MKARAGPWGLVLRRDLTRPAAEAGRARRIQAA